MEREQERESERQSVTPHRRVKRPICRLLETQRRESQSVTASRPPKMALGHFSTEARMIVASMVRSLLRR